MYDLIGDIHGHCSELIKLLNKLGYKNNNNLYEHPTNRKVVFVGDYIDRGPQIKETLALVKSMVDNGNAIALMGNHEYNALVFNTKNKVDGGYLRKHNIKNIVQHYETLRQFKGEEELYQEYINWFKTLAVFYENEFFRVVHACWDETCINFLRKELGGNLLNDNFLIEATKKGSLAYSHINDTLKGKELALPLGLSFFDKDGFERKNIRIRWWENPEDLTWGEYAVSPIKNLPNSKVGLRYYYENEKPVFFGHYWLKGAPSLMTSTACCLDYSVAKGDRLVAYRWNKGVPLSDDNFVWVTMSPVK